MLDGIDSKQGGNWERLSSYKILKRATVTPPEYEPQDPGDQPTQRLNFMVTFSATDEIKSKIHAKVLDVIKEMEQLVQTAPAVSLCQFNIDLFPWIEDA